MTRFDDESDVPTPALVTRRLALRFDEFGWEALESAAKRDAQALNDHLALAIAYFDSELPAARPALLVPTFKPDGAGGKETSRRIGIGLTRDCWERLQIEAARQGVALERLLEHAVLFYLAELEAGRVAAQLLDRALRERDAGN